MVLEIAEKLLEKHPDLHVYMIGDGELMPELIEYLVTHHLEFNIHFLGFIPHEQLKYYFEQAMLMLMPSQSEPFGLVGLEAIACNVPLLISKNSGLSEILSDELQLCPNDLSSWIKLINQCLENPTYLEKCRLKQKQNISSLSWKKTSEKLKYLFEGILK
jgi:glycogen(starch) synthase